MDIGDVCDASHGERHHHFIDDLAGKTNHQRRAEVYDMAHDMASAEMLDEIHAMLRELLLRQGVPVYAITRAVQPVANPSAEAVPEFAPNPACQDRESYMRNKRCQYMGCPSGFAVGEID